MQTNSKNKTPEAISILLNKLVLESSQNAVAKGSGLTLLTVQNMLKGIGEPRLSTLQRIADYTGVTITITISPEIELTPDP